MGCDQHNCGFTDGDIAPKLGRSENPQSLQQRELNGQCSRSVVLRWGIRIWSSSSSHPRTCHTRTLGHRSDGSGADCASSQTLGVWDSAQQRKNGWHREDANRFLFSISSPVGFVSESLANRASHSRDFRRVERPALSNRRSVRRYRSCRKPMHRGIRHGNADRGATSEAFR